MSGLRIENCSASLAMSLPCFAQCSAARCGDLPHLRRRLVPRRQRRVRQQPRRERGRVHDADALLLQVRHEVGQHRVLERVVVVRQDHVEVGAGPARTGRSSSGSRRSRRTAPCPAAATLRRAGSVSSTICRMSTNSMSWQRMMSRWSVFIRSRLTSTLSATRRAEKSKCVPRVAAELRARACSCRAARRAARRRAAPPTSRGRRTARCR